jgi:hypothetical protein
MSPASNQANRPHSGPRRTDGFDQHRLAEQRADEELTLFRDERKIHIEDDL